MIDTSTVLQQLVNWTVKHSGHEERGYIGLSGIYECERAIYDRVRFGQRWSVDEHLRTRLSYELESALIERLRGAGLYGEGEEISLYDGLVQGHTDGSLLVPPAERVVLEIKTVSYDAHFPGARVPERVYWQVQAYMHYLQRREALVLYMARASGEVRAYPLRYNVRLGMVIDAKVRRLVSSVQKMEKPACSCGECGSNSSL